MVRTDTTNRSPTAPGARDRDLCLCVDEHPVGGGMVLRAHVVLVHVREPGAAQRRLTGLDHGGQPDVAGLGHQQRRHAHREVLGARRDVREVGVSVQQPGPGVHLQQQFRQVDERHHRLRRRTQPDQAVGFVERVKVVDDQPGAAIRAGHDPGPRVVAGVPKAGCGLLPRRVQRDQLTGVPSKSSCRTGPGNRHIRETSVLPSVSAILAIPGNP